MTCFVDTNVLLRLADQGSPQHEIARTAVERLISSGVSLKISLQVLVEFWAVATRPATANGLGWSTEQCASVVRSAREQFDVLMDIDDAQILWLDLVVRCQVSGKRTHDARLAALLLAHGISRLLTFNLSDFPPLWGIEAVDPSRV